MKNIAFTFLLFLSLPAISQVSSLRGSILQEDGTGLPFATAVLLDPADSTLAYYGITNDRGEFLIRNISRGSYLMQVAFIGYQTIYREMAFPDAAADESHIFVLKEAPIGIDGVSVIGEAVPLAIKQDTIEYNRAAFKVQEDAVVEDLLKKLPGIEVDRAGNIKALGEDVQRVYVDGKEFFGSDPKVATKNIPARAVDKVQMYDKKSDESEFTGINDGSRDKTLNLVLEEDMKKAVFGHVSAGAGTSSRYEADAKAYYFTDKVHVAGLGMLNNVNRFGFSFSDYLDFSGGISGMGAGSGRISIPSDGSFPVNFGQPVNGLNTSGAAGLNLSHSTDKNNREYISYLGNMTQRDLQEEMITRNYLPGGEYYQESVSKEDKKDLAHRINLGFRRRIDSTQNLIVNGSIGLNYGNSEDYRLAYTYMNETLANSLLGESADQLSRINGKGGFTYLNKLRADRTVLKVNADLSLNRSLSEIRIGNLFNHYNPPGSDTIRQYQDTESNNLAYGGGIYLTQRLSGRIYLVPGIQYRNRNEDLSRTQGLKEPDDAPIDSLSPVLNKSYEFFKPGLTLMRNTDKSKLSLAVDLELGSLDTRLNQEGLRNSGYAFVLPRLNYEYEFRTSRRISFYYNSRITEPSASQLLPVVNNINPLYQVYGNPNLIPEYEHRGNVHFFMFDQFSFTSLFGVVSGTYTRDKINWSRMVDADLVQHLMPVNVDHDYELRASIDFSTPVKILGVKFHLALEERWNQGLTRVNGVENVNTTVNHRVSLSADNRKKQKWDINSGIGLNFTNTRFSVQENLNDRYSDYSWFAELSYTPNKTIDVHLTGDVVHYNSQSFQNSLLVPLVGGEINYHFLAGKRGMLTLRVFDLLDMNKGIQRISELNYLREIRRNTLGRYFMISFRYRLNKFGNSGNGLEIKMKQR